MPPPAFDEAFEKVSKLAKTFLKWILWVTGVLHSGHLISKGMFISLVQKARFFEGASFCVARARKEGEQSPYPPAMEGISKTSSPSWKR